MTWLSEFGYVVYEAARLRSADDALDAAREVVLAGHPNRLLEAFPDGVRVDDPRLGRVEGEEALRNYCRTSAAWLEEREASTRLIATTVGRDRTVGEFDVALVVAGTSLTLPVAVVVEPGEDGRSVWIRSYHSQWPLLGHHVVRGPLVERDPDAEESDIVREYQAALAAGDAARLTATFETDGCFREPSGPEYQVCGTASLRAVFDQFFAAGGIELEHCTVTEDGVRTALEYNAVRWGETPMTPQAGVAVYERGTSGLLRAARIYDDVQPPFET